jgi:hypothetical protein
VETSRAVARRADDLVRRCSSGLRGAAFQAQVVRAIHALLPVDAVFLATADPETLLLTSIFAEEPLAHVADQFLDNEFGQDDVNKFQSLATGARHVATLDSATHGDRAGSARYREIMTPLGLGDELRAALVTPSGCWGYVCLHRNGFARCPTNSSGTHRNGQMAAGPRDTSSWLSGWRHRRHHRAGSPEPHCAAGPTLAWTHSAGMRRSPARAAWRIDESDRCRTPPIPVHRQGPHQGDL